MIRSIAFCTGFALAWCGTASAQGVTAFEEPVQQLNDQRERFCVQQNDKCELIGGLTCQVGEGLTRKQIMQCKPVDAAKVEADELKERVKRLEDILADLLDALTLQMKEMLHESIEKPH